MAQQIADMARDPDYDGVVLEFVTTATDPISDTSQIVARLAGVDLTRVMIRLVEATDPTPSDFVPAGQ
jgi:hypothetical protein